jgi:hypothetical protein
MHLVFKIVIAWIFAFGVGSFVYLANADEQRTHRVIENPVQDGNMVLRINDGGVKKDAITVTGSTGATTIGPSSSTETQNINGRKLNINTSPGSVSLGNTSSPNGTGIVGSIDVGSSFMSMTNNTFVDFDGGSAKFVSVTDGGGGRAGLFFCDFNAAGCIELADPSTFFSNALTCGTGIIVAKVAATDHTVRVRNCSGATLNISVAFIGQGVSDVGNLNSAL